MALFLGIVLQFITVQVLAYTESDRKECGTREFGSVTCTSLNFFYRECQVPGAEIIHLIKLHESHSTETCEFKSTFGFRGSAVWVTNGCSGTFYLCFNGDPVSSTDRPAVDKGTNKPPTAVESASAVSGNDVLIYIIVASCVVLLVGVGLLVGCLVKRRQQSDTSKHLAEKRQIRIALREHMEDREENGITMLPMATRSLSVESLRNCDYEKEGSEYSSRSSTSGMTSVSAQVTGNLTRTRSSLRSSVSYAPSGRLKKGYSTPDIHALGRMYCEANMLNRHSRSSIARSSQSSLNSIREVCQKYQMFDIPLEKRIKQQTRRSVKFNTVGFVETCADRTYRSGTQTMPHNRTITRAVVHAPSPSFNGHLSRSSSIKSTRSARNSTSDYEPSKLTIYEHPTVLPSRKVSQEYQLQYEPKSISHVQRNAPSPTRNQAISIISGNDVTSHYHDPDSLHVRQSQTLIRKPLVETPRANSPYGRQSPNPDKIYSKVVKPKILHPKPILGNNIYATVNKSMFKAASKVPWGTQPTAPTSVGSPNPPESKPLTYIQETPKEAYHSIEIEDADSGIENLGYTITDDEIYYLEDDEEDVRLPEKENMYARLETFKPVVTSPFFINGLTETTSNI